MGKWTKGPWETGEGYGCFVVFPPEGDEPLCIDIQNPHDCVLIAAAPDLVEALLGLFAFPARSLPPDHPWRDAVGAARDALVKAGALNPEADGGGA